MTTASDQERDRRQSRCEWQADSERARSPSKCRADFSSRRAPPGSTSDASWHPWSKQEALSRKPKRCLLCPATFHLEFATNGHQRSNMNNTLKSVISIAIGGMAIHGVIAACGNINPTITDAQAADSAISHNDGAAPTLDGSQANETGIPPGTIVAFGGAIVPSGWLLCDGAEVKRSMYAGLFSAIAVNFGGGDRVTTFNVPDLRGRFMRGVDSGAGRDPDASARAASNLGGPAGDSVGTLQDAATAAPFTPFVSEQSGSHTHTSGNFNRLLQYTGRNTNNGTDGTDNTGSEPDITVSQPMLSGGAHTHRIGRTFGSGGDSETRPKNVDVNYIIKI